MALESSYTSNGSTVIGGEQSYFELPPANGTATRATTSPAPPTAVVIDFSNPLPLRQLLRTTSSLIRSANSAGGAVRRRFRHPGRGRAGQHRHRLHDRPRDYTVTLYNYNPIDRAPRPGRRPGGSGNRLVLQLAPGTTLPADDYRVYMPNQVEPDGNDTRIFDIYGNQLDGEFLGNQTSQNSPDFQPSDAECHAARVRGPAVQRHLSARTT